MSALLITIIAYAIIFISGYWMNHMGRPYNRIIFSFHKLLTLGVLVYLILVFRTAQDLQPFNLQEWILAALGISAYIVALVSGGVLNLPREMPRFVNILHHSAPYVVVVTTLLLMYRRFWGV